MLARKYRLRKNDIERLYKRGRTFRLDSMLLRYAGNSTDHFRFAVIVPKKTASKASQRNRLKRKTHAILDEILSERQLSNTDIALTYKSLPKEENIKAAIVQVFSKINLLK